MPGKTKKTVKEPPFEEALESLERIVRDLEQADLPLEKALELFEEGVRLSRFCGAKLDEAEKKIEVLVKGAGGEWRPQRWESGDEGESDESGGQSE